MNIPSSFNLGALPNLVDFKKLCKALSTLDAIICPEWESRYYSYQKDWDKILGEECMEMRNGCGDHFFVLFSKSGAIINGQAHESEMCDWKDVEVEKPGFLNKLMGNKETVLKITIWDGLFEHLPDEFSHFIFGEPIKSIGTTFCLWRKNTDSSWQKGNFVYPNDEYKDGSEDLLYILDNKPETYYEWATEYYEDAFDCVDIKSIKQIYMHTPLTTELVYKLNPEYPDLEDLKKDLDEIGYPYLF
jgi:hypothetical protein